MAKGIKLSEFGKGSEKSRKISMRNFGGFVRSKTVICNYLKSPHKYGTRNTSGRPEKLSPQFKRRIVREVKRKLRQHQK